MSLARTALRPAFRASSAATKAFSTSAARSQYKLPDLPYDFGALEPHISGRIMEVSISPLQSAAHFTISQSQFPLNSSNMTIATVQLQSKQLEKQHSTAQHITNTLRTGPLHQAPPNLRQRPQHHPRHAQLVPLDPVGARAAKEHLAPKGSQLPRRWPPQPHALLGEPVARRKAGRCWRRASIRQARKRD